MTSIAFNKSSIVLNLFIGKTDGISSDFYAWFWFVENIVKIKSVRELDKPWLFCQLPRTMQYDKNKRDNFRRLLKRFCDWVLKPGLPFQLHVADDDENKEDISVHCTTNNFGLLRHSLFGVVEKIGEAVYRELTALKYGSFFRKLQDGIPDVLYGPLSFVNNRCGSELTFGEVKDSILKLKTTSAQDPTKKIKVKENTEVLIKYLDGKKKYVCECQEHRRKRMRSEMKKLLQCGHTFQV
jgi:hypothetical protein